MKNQKVANYLKNGILLLGVSVLLWNCEKQEILSEEPVIVNTIDKISSVFNKEQFKEVIPYQFNVNWQNNGIKYSKELETSYYEFNLSYTSSLTPYINIANKKIGDYYKSFKIIATVNKEKEFVSFYALRVYQKIQQTGEPIAKINLESATNFNGIIHVININNEIVFAKKLEQGKSTGKDYFSKEFKNLDPYKSREREVCVTVYIEHYEDRYNVDDTGTRYYMGTNYLGRSTETICAYEYLPDYGGYNVGNGGGNNGANGPGAGTYKSDCSSSGTKNKNNLFARESEECATKITEKVEEGCQKGYVLNDEKKCVKEVQIILDPSFENSVANCALKLLKENKQFNEILDKLIPKNSKYDVVFKVGVAGGSGGHTSGNTNPNVKEIYITINKNHLTNSIVSIAQTILHESVHARLIEQIKSIGGMDKLNEFSNLDTEIERLAAYYNKYGPKHNSPQHHFMWKNYVDEIAKGTEAIHKLFPDNYNRFHNYMQDNLSNSGYNKNTFYKFATQAGMSKTTYYKSLTQNVQDIIKVMDSKLKANGQKIINDKTCK